jgi:hypothetical protein
MRTAPIDNLRLSGIVALALLVSACGGGGSNSDSSGVTTSSTTTSSGSGGTGSGGGGGGGSTPPATYVLSVSGSSQGVVSSSPAGINCGATCSTSLADGTSVTLTATPQSGYSFSGWGGACSGTGTCTLTMNSDKAVTATFAAVASNYALTISKVGSGTVTSTSGAINCGATCSATLSSGTSVTLNASPTSGYTFSGWSGSGCSGTGTCVVTMSAARTVVATFVSSTGGITYYVAPTGSDSNNGRSLAAPFKTIGKAVNSVAAGDIIEVRAGTYVVNTMITTPGSSSGWITMRGYNGETPVIRNANNSSPTIYFYHDDCDESVIGNGSGNTDCRPFYWILQGLQIEGPTAGDDGNAVKIDTPKVKLVGNKLCCAYADVVKVVRTANDTEILNNEIWQDSRVSSNAQGVDIVGADRVRVAGNYVHNVTNIGIYAKGNSRNPVFENNLLVNIGDANNGHALMLGQDTDDYRLVDGNYETYDGIARNNVVVNATWSCVATSSSYNVHIYNNSCYNTGTSTHGSIFLSNESSIGQTGANIEIRNNIVYGSANNPVVKIDNNAMSSYTTLYIDHNIYYVSGGAPKFTWDEAGLSNSSFSSWQTQIAARTGHADSSIVANPLYSDTSTSSSTALTLQATSPAINAGVTSSYVTTDKQGTARPQGSGVDIGAYEY